METRVQARVSPVTKASSIWRNAAVLASTILVSGVLMLGSIQSAEAASRKAKSAGNGKTHAAHQEKNIPNKDYRARPRWYDKIGYKNSFKHDFSNVELEQKESVIGRIQRTLRFKKIYNAIEDAYGIPRDVIGAMIMEESYGDPVQPNSSGDGGLGLVHIQGTTGPLYGLKVIGHSTSAADFDHGEQIKLLLEKCEYNPVCVQGWDERGHILKVLDTAGRIVAEGMALHGGKWKHGVAYFNAPGGVGKLRGWRYTTRIKRWRAYLQDNQKLKAAAKEFKEDNGYPFNQYLGRNYQTDYNWGLEYYRSVMRLNKKSKANKSQKFRPQKH